MAAWKNWLHSRPLEPLLPTPHAGVEAVRRQVLELLEDCDGVECERLRWRLHTAEYPQELWLLRDAVFQMVASQHCRSQAADRLDRLLPAFQRLMPAAATSRA